ncbi:MAG: hypothetical protein MUE72_07865, partial [Chitinophagaceae bacterium]|nr:hypothetical protein [Chitinophagaceae bacterium]
MKFSFFILYAVIICLQSCKDNKTKDSTEMLKELVKHENIIVENFNFQFDLPQDWYRLDTVFQGIQLNLIMNNDETYQPRINITRELMNGINHS